VSAHSSPRARLTLDHSSVKVITAEEDVHQFPLAGIDSIVAFAPNNGPSMWWRHCI
jgi:hypothetical protein